MDLDELLEIEAGIGLWDEVSDDGNLHLWPFARIHILIASLSQARGYANPHADRKNHLRPNPKYLFQTFTNSPFRMPRTPMIVFSSGIANVPDGSMFRNRLYDHWHGLANGRLGLIEDSYQGAYRRPRAVPVRYNDSIQIQGNLLGLASQSLDRRPNADIENFIKKIRTGFDFLQDEGTWSLVRRQLNKIKRSYPFFKHSYQKLFNQTQPSFVCLEDGSYGPRSYILKIARDMGIRTGEFQHGLVTRHHPAYNFPPTLLAGHPAAVYLPEFFLTYGEYWSNSIRIPGVSIPIGNPYLMGLAGQSPKGPEVDFLVISDPLSPDQFSRFAAQLSHQYPNASICFKLHPMEFQLVHERYGALANLPNLTIATTESVYSLLSRSRFIIASVSTVVFEALAFGKVPFVFDSALSRANIEGEFIPRFESFEALQKLISMSPVSISRDRLHHFWESDGDRILIQLMKDLHC